VEPHQQRDENRPPLPAALVEIEVLGRNSSGNRTDEEAPLAHLGATAMETAAVTASATVPTTLVPSLNGPARPSRPSPPLRLLSMPAPMTASDQFPALVNLASLSQH